MKQKRPLARTEWDFDSVPQDEIEPCCLYEYAREYFKDSRVLKNLRRQWQVYEEWRTAGKPPRNRRPSLGRLAEVRAWRVINSRGNHIPMAFQTFPTMSWQDLRQRPGLESWPVKDGKWEAVESDRRRKRASDRFHIETLAQLEPANIRSLPVWMHCHEWLHRVDLTNTEYGFFAVDWNYPLPEIRLAFETWLEEYTKTRKSKPTIISPSRGQFRDKLRLLGGLRFKEHYRKKDLVAYDDSKLKIEPAPYKHFPDLVDAATKAKGLLREMFPSEAEAKQIAEQAFGDDGPRVNVNEVHRLLGVGSKS